MPSSDHGQTSRSKRASLMHRIIHTVEIPLEEYWKKNSLARNPELGAMIQNTTTCFFDGARDRCGLVGR
jgi:7-cyano-7-deazaguanine synthase in queuosine biosynthesis